MCNVKYRKALCVVYSIERHCVYTVEYSEALFVMYSRVWRNIYIMYSIVRSNLCVLFNYV